MTFITTTRLWYNSVVKLQETTKHSRQRPCFLKINNHWSWMSYLTASSQGSLLPIASLQVLTTPAFPLTTPAFPLSTPAFPLSTPAFPLSTHMSKHLSKILQDVSLWSRTPSSNRKPPIPHQAYYCQLGHLYSVARLELMRMGQALHLSQHSPAGPVHGNVSALSQTYCYTQ